MDKQFLDSISALDSASIDELNAHIDSIKEARRPKPTLESIKPGMSAEDKVRVKAEIARVLKGL